MNQKAMILIIDDDEGILESLSILLEEGYEVKTLADGKKAIDFVQKYQPSLIILDMLLSGSDGRELCHQIKKTPGINQIPILLTSAHPTAAHAIQAGDCQAFLSKPFEVDDLLKQMRILLNN